MEFSSNIAIWVQIAAAIRNDIASGKLSPGSKLPGGRELALQYSVNPNTAARVYQELEKDGICVTRRGLGTYVTEDTSRISALRRESAGKLIGLYLSQMRALGYSDTEAREMITKESEL